MRPYTLKQTNTTRHSHPLCTSQRTTPDTAHQQPHTPIHSRHPEPTRTHESPKTTDHRKNPAQSTQFNYPRHPPRQHTTRVPSGPNSMSTTHQHPPDTVPHPTACPLPSRKETHQAVLNHHARINTLHPTSIHKFSSTQPHKHSLQALDLHTTNRTTITHKPSCVTPSFRQPVACQ